MQFIQGNTTFPAHKSNHNVHKTWCHLTLQHHQTTPFVLILMWKNLPLRLKLKQVLSYPVSWLTENRLGTISIIDWLCNVLIPLVTSRLRLCLFDSSTTRLHGQPAAFLLIWSFFLDFYTVSFVFVCFYDDQLMKTDWISLCHACAWFTALLDLLDAD